MLIANFQNMRPFLGLQKPHAIDVGADEATKSVRLQRIPPHPSCVMRAENRSTFQPGAACATLAFGQLHAVFASGHRERAPAILCTRDGLRKDYWLCLLVRTNEQASNRTAFRCASDKTAEPLRL